MMGQQNESYLNGQSDLDHFRIMIVYVADDPQHLLRTLYVPDAVRATPNYNVRRTYVVRRVHTMHDVH